MRNLKPIKKALLIYIAATILEKTLRKKDEKMWQKAISHARRQLDLELSLIKRHFQRDE